MSASIASSRRAPAGTRTRTRGSLPRRSRSALRRRPLNDLVLERRDREQSLPPIRLGYVDPPGGLRRRSPMQPRVQVLDALEVCLVGRPGQPVHAGAAFGSSSPMPPRCSMLTWWQRSEPLLLPLLAVRRMRSSACATVSRLGIRPVLCWLAFPLVSALGSTNSATHRSALFIGFTATMAESDFPRSCIIGFGSSPSRCGPPASSADGRTQDLPVSVAILSCVMGSPTTAERQRLACRRCSCCLRLCQRTRPLREVTFAAQ